MDRIMVRDLDVSCVIGVHDWERRTRQRLLVSLELATSTASAASTDELSRTIDYAAVCSGVNQIARQGRFKLLETLAERIAQWLLETQGADQVSVEIHKPSAVRQARSVGVHIVRPRSTKP